MWDSGITLLSSLDDRTWEALCDLQPNDAVAVVDHVAEVMRREHVRNPAAFFMRASQRYLVSPPPNASYNHLLAGTADQARRQPDQAPQTLWLPPSSGGASALKDLPDDLRSRALGSITKNPRSLNEGTFDTGVVQGLLKISPAQAQECFDELDSVNLSNVRNPTAFIMGMIKKRKH